uniref:Uncharacterized protein n=1 Tax=Amphimedon queenslandica TaxID=400682 RepID=A0A1X7UL14_AMPQE
MYTEEIAKLLKTGNKGFWSSHSALRILLLPYAEPSDDGKDEFDGLLLTTPDSCTSHHSRSFYSTWSSGKRSMMMKKHSSLLQLATP